MAILQIIAAEMAGVERLVFYTVDAKGSTELDQALYQINSFSEPILDTTALLTRIGAMGFEWGHEDGN